MKWNASLCCADRQIHKVWAAAEWIPHLPSSIWCFNLNKVCAWGTSNWYRLSEWNVASSIYSFNSNKIRLTKLESWEKSVLRNPTAYRFSEAWFIKPWVFYFATRWPVVTSPAFAALFTIYMMLWERDYLFRRKYKACWRIAVL